MQIVSRELQEKKVELFIYGCAVIFKLCECKIQGSKYNVVPGHGVDPYGHPYGPHSALPAKPPITERVFGSSLVHRHWARS